MGYEEQLAGALSGIVKLIDSGDLVRNIKDDANWPRFIEQGIRITNALYAAQTTLERYEKHKQALLLVAGIVDVSSEGGNSGVGPLPGH